MKAGVLVVLTVAAMMLAGTAMAADQCSSFHALLPGELFPADILVPGDVWGGSFYGYLGEQFVMGRYSGNNGDASYVVGHAGHGVDGRDTFDFGDGNRLEAIELNASFPMPTGQFPGFAGGLYSATDRIVGGTGIFADATGTLIYTGPWVTWGNEGRWNGEVNGRICGIEQ